jgi:predicted AAA+ superfamily ATPase
MSVNCIERALILPCQLSRSFFLWGTRKVGKSFLLRKTYPDAIYINLLNTKTYFKYLKEPWLLREELLSIKKDKGEITEAIILDEVQRVPLLLDEVHLLIEEEGMKFILCGSSARKLKRGQANLLGGRALRYELLGFSAFELGEEFDLNRILNHGYIPDHYFENKPLLKQQKLKRRK